METIQQFKELLYKPMSRGEFLKYAGVIILSTIGIVNILKNVISYDKESSTYGHANYEGRKGGLI